MDIVEKTIAGLIVILLAIVLVSPIVGAYNKAKVFNKLTGKSVTTWEALWVDLRVMEPVK